MNRGYSGSISVKASDPDGYVRSVSFYVDGRLAATIKNPPYVTSIIRADKGPVDVTVIAVDDEGATARATAQYEVIDCPSGQVCAEELSVFDALCCSEPPAVEWVTASAKRHVTPADIPLEVT